MRALILSFIAVASLTLAAQTPPCTPAQTNTARSMTAVDLEKAGDACRLQKDYDQAIRYFSEALRTDKKNAKLYNKRGLSELSLGAYAAAKEDFTKATKYNRNYQEAWNDLGVVAYLEKRYPAAVRYFSKAIALDDNRPNFHVNLGITYFAQNQMDLAMAQYTRAVQLDPDALNRTSNAALSALISDRDQQAKQDFMMARIYAKLGQVDRCLVCLEKAKENGYSDLNTVYKEDDFSAVRKDARLATIVPPPVPQK
jgi:tetratricopeptide (TPR) repeat protein